jgi:hypothetical protein
MVPVDSGDLEVVEQLDAPLPEQVVLVALSHLKNIQQKVLVMLSPFYLKSIGSEEE